MEGHIVGLAASEGRDVLLRCELQISDVELSVAVRARLVVDVDSEGFDNSFAHAISPALPAYDLHLLVLALDPLMRYLRLVVLATVC